VAQILRYGTYPYTLPLDSPNSRSDLLPSGVDGERPTKLVTYDPQIALRNDGPTEQGIDLGIPCTRIRAGHDAPLAPVPVQHQRELLIRSVGSKVRAECPNIVRRYRSDSLKQIGLEFSFWPNIRAGDNRPTSPVPVLDERQGWACGIHIFRVVAHGPDVVRRQRSHTLKNVESQTWARTWNRAPRLAIVMLDGGLQLRTRFRQPKHPWLYQHHRNSL
jgi:hypothetical protein